MLTLQKVSKKFDGHEVINSLSLNVEKGEIFGFLGSNGAGKTTTIKIIADLLFPDTGTISIAKINHQKLEAKMLMGYMPEQPSFYRALTATETLEFLGKLFNEKEATLKKRIPKLLAQVGLSSAANQKVGQYSKGMTQRLGFAAALINDPQILLLDEPLDGLDPIGRLDFKKLLGELKKQKKTVFFSSHILSDIEEVCDRIAIIHKGQIILEGNPKKLTKKNQTLEELFVEAIR